MSEIITWDPIAANNNSAPPDGWPENMAYSAVNDCAREMMAAAARDLADRNGTLSTTGVQPAYALTSNRTISGLVDGLLMAFRVHSTCTGSFPVTLNLNGLGAFPVELPGPAPLSTYPALSVDDIHVVVWDDAQSRWQLLTPVLGGAIGGYVNVGASVSILAAHLNGPILLVDTPASTITIPAGVYGRIRIFNPDRYSYTIQNSSGNNLYRSDDPTTTVSGGSFSTTNVAATLILSDIATTFAHVYLDTLA